MVLEDAAHPQAGGILQRVQPDALAVEIGRFVNAAAGSFHHILMAKTAVRKYWNSVVVASPVPRYKIAYQRQLAHVELLMAQHSSMSLGRGHSQHVQIDPLRLDFAVDQRAQKIVVAAGEGQVQSGHSISLQSFKVQCSKFKV